MTTRPRALILRTAGTNCDRETVYAFEQAGAAVDLVHLNRMVETPEKLFDYRILVFPGGFTYGDDLGAGTIFANRLRSSLLDPMREFVAGGGLALGICNGFQILVKIGLLPGTADPEDPPVASLVANDSNRFEERWVTLEVTSDRSAFVKRGDRIFCPVAHGEGKFITASDEAHQALFTNDQVVFRYVGRDGSENPAYPENPNGSRDAIAGICDPTGRVLGMMPHPERHLDATLHPRWTREGLELRDTGRKLFANAVAH
ncbi:MAG: phosphoribosylformylglycinamidine synthase I, partial [Planctomycetota bacterium]